MKEAIDNNYEAIDNNYDQDIPRVKLLSSLYTLYIIVTVSRKRDHLSHITKFHIYLPADSTQHAL